MASLFDDLPALKEPRSLVDEEPAVAQTSEGPVREIQPVKNQQPDHHGRPEKRQRLDEQDANPSAILEAGGASGANQVTQALQKLAHHIGKPQKFAKASALLRQLIDGGGLERCAWGTMQASRGRRCL